MHAKAEKGKALIEDFDIYRIVQKQAGQINVSVPDERDKDEIVIHHSAQLAPCCRPVDEQHRRVSSPLVARVAILVDARAAALRDLREPDQEKTPHQPASAQARTVLIRQRLALWVV